MKPLRAFAILFVALLLSNVTTYRNSVRAVQPQADVTHIVEPPGVSATHSSKRFVPDNSFMSSAVTSSANTWHIDCVDCPKQFWRMTDRSLQIDSQGHPHIVYGGEQLYYVWSDGLQWHYETVDASRSAGDFASLALDKSGQPHISYIDSNRTVKYASRDGDSWHVQTVDAGWDPSLALDSAGQPHISYYDDYFDDLKHAWYDGTTWHKETIDSAGDVGWGNSIALDKADQPHIIYHDDTHGNLRYAWDDGIAWHIEIADGGPYVGYDPSLALDALDQPHVSYSRTTDSAQYYAWRDETGWHIEAVDSRGGRQGTLVLDASGRPHISYSHYLWGLYYAWRDTTGWQVEHVDDSDSRAISLVLDASGLPHISSISEGLTYRWYDGTGWQTLVLDKNADVGYDTSLKVDKSGEPHISYLDQTYLNFKLKYAWHGGNEWHVETIDRGGGWDTSLALDKLGRPHISYLSSFQVKYAWHDDTNWHVETAIDTGELSQYTSLALDSFGQPHISYYDLTYNPRFHSYYGALRYAWRDAHGWHMEIVDGEWISGAYASSLEGSLALDGLDHPQISYCSGLNLRYAWHDGANWHSETVSSEGCADSSLVLDNASQPYIGFSDGQGLKHTWRDETGWHVEIVDSGGGSSISLALGPSGYPRISYVNGGLKYAWYDGTQWHTDTAQVENIGGFASLALDDAGRAHISYHGGFPTGLNYALQPLSVDKQITSAGDVHNGTILTFTLNLAGIGHEMYLSDPLPSMVDYIPDSITTNFTPTAVYSSSTRAILWHGTSTTYTIPSIRFQVMAKITGTGALSVPVPVVNTAWLTDLAASTSISSTTTTHIMPLPLFLKKDAVPSSDLRPGDTLSYTLTFSGSGQTVLLQDYLPAEVEYISGSITSTLTPMAIYNATSRAITWEGILPVGAMQTILFQVMPLESERRAAGPVRAFSNTAWLTCTSGLESGRAISATVDVNVQRAYLPAVMK